jgi:hypothetical protein
MVNIRFSLSVLVTTLLLLSAPSAWADSTVTAHLKGSNHSGVTGTATLTATDAGGLRVVIHARGLVPGIPHAQHIHGAMGGGHFRCPTAANDVDGDGLLTNEEAAGEYGNVFVALTTKGDTSPKSGLALDRMPVADSAGHLDYERTFSRGELPAGLVKHLSEVHVVQHGIDVNHNGRYDMAGAGVSTFAQNLGVSGVPEEATDPASCGVVTGAMAPMSPHGGVETGGGPVGSVNAPLAASGVLLVLGSLAVLWRVGPWRVGSAKAGRSRVPER